MATFYENQECIFPFAAVAHIYKGSGQLLITLAGKKEEVALNNSQQIADFTEQYQGWLTPQT